MIARQKFVLAVEPDPWPHLVVERGPKNEGVGPWVPRVKHTLLAKWLGGTKNAWVRWPNRVLIDPFCGPGRIQVKGESFTRDGGSVVAWRESVRLGMPFTSILVGDIDQERVEACAERLRALPAPVQPFIGPASETAPKMVAAVPRNALALAYVDPYSLEFLSFDVIRAIAELEHVDFAVHFSTMDLQRNADMELDQDRARFDQAAPGWREHVLARGVSKSELPVVFFDYWCGLIRHIGFTFSKAMPLVYDENNRPLYRLVFFSRHDFPKKIWSDVAKSPNRELFV